MLHALLKWLSVAIKHSHFLTNWWSLHYRDTSWTIVVRVELRTIAAESPGHAATLLATLCFKFYFFWDTSLPGPIRNWVVVHCYLLPTSTVKMEALYSSERPVKFYCITRYNAHIFHIHRLGTALQIHHQLWMFVAPLAPRSFKHCSNVCLFLHIRQLRAYEPSE
jgi:hypothetical protein